MLHYLSGIVDFSLDYRRSEGIKLVGYTDSYWVGSEANRNSNSGCCFSLGSATVSWFSRKQKFVALTTIEDEYMVANLANCEALWLHKLLVNLFGQELRPTVIYCDNQSCIHLSKNHVFHDRSKHVEISWVWCKTPSSVRESVDFCTKESIPLVTFV